MEPAGDSACAVANGSTDSEVVREPCDGDEGRHGMNGAFFEAFEKSQHATAIDRAGGDRSYSDDPALWMLSYMSETACVTAKDADHPVYAVEEIDRFSDKTNHTLSEKFKGDAHGGPGGSPPAPPGLTPEDDRKVATDTLLRTCVAVVSQSVARKGGPFAPLVTGASAFSAYVPGRGHTIGQALLPAGPINGAEVGSREGEVRCAMAPEIPSNAGQDNEAKVKVDRLPAGQAGSSQSKVAKVPKARAAAKKVKGGPTKPIAGKLKVGSTKPATGARKSRPAPVTGPAKKAQKIESNCKAKSRSVPAGDLAKKLERIQSNRKASAKFRQMNRESRAAVPKLKAEKEELQGKVQSLLARVKWLESIVDWQAVGNCTSPDSDRGAREPEEGEML